MPSDRFQLNMDDAKRIARNALIFLAPALIVFLTQLQAGVPMGEALVALKLWALNTAIDLLRKFISN